MRIKNRYNRITGSKYQRYPKKKFSWLIPEILKNNLAMYVGRNKELLTNYFGFGILSLNPNPFHD